MVGIREDLRSLFVQLSLAGMPNDELMALYGTMTEEEGQLSLFEDDRIPEKLKERTEMFLKRDLSKRKKCSKPNAYRPWWSATILSREAGPYAESAHGDLCLGQFGINGEALPFRGGGEKAHGLRPTGL